VPDMLKGLSHEGIPRHGEMGLSNMQLRFDITDKKN